MAKYSTTRLGLLRTMTSVLAWGCLHGGVLLAEEASDQALSTTQWQWGWEVRTQHFIVFCTTTRQQAQWAASQAEEALVDTQRLSSRWTDRGRQQRFGRPAIGIFITDRPLDARNPGGPRLALTDYGHDIYINLQSGTAELSQRLPQLRRETFNAQLRSYGQDQLLPKWVQTGLANYIAEEKLSAVNQMETLAIQTNRRETLLVKYLIEGDDARHATDFFAAMSATIAQYRPDPFGSPVGWNERVLRLPPGNRRLPRRFPLEELVATPAVQQGFAKWLAEPKQGQSGPQPTRPKVNEFVKDGSRAAK